MSRRGRFSIILALAMVYPWLSSCASVRSMSAALGDAQRMQRDVQHTARDLRARVQRVQGYIPVTVLDDVSDLLSQAAANIGPEEEYYLGRSVLAELLTDYDNSLVGITGTGREAEASPELVYVGSVAQVVFEAAAARPQRQDRRQTGLRVAVVRSEVPNAYATPGGFVLVTTGLLRLTESEDELAAVLAHEMAHIILGHGIAALGQDRVTRPIRDLSKRLEEVTGSAREQLLGELADDLGDFSSGIADSLRGGYDRRWEHQADARAANILTAAGYDAEALVRIIDRVDGWQRSHGAKGTASTHPPASARADALSQLPQHRLGEEERRQAEAVRADRFAAHVPPMGGGEVARR